MQQYICNVDIFCFFFSFFFSYLFHYICHDRIIYLCITDDVSKSLSQILLDSFVDG